MKPIFVRKAVVSELPTIIDWGNKKNKFDSGVIGYPATTTFCAYNGRPITFMPVQTCYILETACQAPDATLLEKADALRQIVHTVHYDSLQSGKGEIYFLGSDPEMNKFAEAHGFEKLDMPVFRLKVQP